MRLKKACALILAAALAAGMAACGGTPAGTSDSQAGSTAQPAGEIDIWAAYEEPVQITTALVENAGIQWHDGDTYDDNPWYREYKERFNIEVTNKWIVSSDYSTKLNLSIADRDIPDVFFCSADQFQLLYEAGMIQD